MVFMSFKFHTPEAAEKVTQQLQKHSPQFSDVSVQVKDKRRSPPSNRSPSAQQRNPHHSGSTDEQESPERVVRHKNIQERIKHITVKRSRALRLTSCPSSRQPHSNWSQWFAPICWGHSPPHKQPFISPSSAHIPVLAFSHPHNKEQVNVSELKPDAGVGDREPHSCSQF